MCVCHTIYEWLIIIRWMNKKSVYKENIILTIFSNHHLTKCSLFFSWMPFFSRILFRSNFLLLLFCLVNENRSLYKWNKKTTTSFHRESETQKNSEKKKDNCGKGNFGVFCHHFFFAFALLSSLIIMANEWMNTEKIVP